MEWLIILGMLVVTFIPRYLPFLLVENLRLPALLLKALPYIPIAVLTTIVAQNSFFIDGNFEFSLSNNRLIAVAFACVIALLTQKLFWTVGGGLTVFFLLQSQWFF